VLDQWGNVNPAPDTPDVGDVPGNDNDVFDFIRLEDIAYDKNDPNVVYIADSGRASSGAASPTTLSTNGRIYKLVLDPNGTDDPTEAEISILVQGDDVATVATDPVGSLGEIHQPDNLETTSTGLLITEDPGSSQQFPAGSTDPNATTGRLWYVPFSGTPQVVVKIDQSADGGPTDVDGRAPGNLGAWETSGIVDASAIFGRGAFLLDVQSHTLWVEKADGEDNFPPAGPDFTYKREGGQLLLLRIPGI
jgi:hypothetical protein